MKTTIEVEWKRAEDGIDTELGDFVAIVGMDGWGKPVFESLESARDYHEQNGLIWYAVIPWPEDPA